MQTKYPNKMQSSYSTKELVAHLKDLLEQDDLDFEMRQMIRKKLAKLEERNEKTVSK